jgi:hypothetical protein
MFNPPTRTGAGHLLHRVNFAVPDNFPAIQPSAPADHAHGGCPLGAADRSEQPIFDTCQCRLDVVLYIEQALNEAEIASAATDGRMGLAPYNQ